MGKSFRSWLLFAPALAVSSALAAQNDPDSSALQIESESFSFAGADNLIHFVRPRIEQAGLKIEADDGFAEGVEVKSQGEMRFTGNVKITVERGVVEADSAVFTFANDNKLSRAELSGMPASFTANRADAAQDPVRGAANEIHFDNVAQTLRMSGSASITKGRVFASGCDMVYDLKTEGIANGPTECGEKYRIRVLNEGADEAPPAAAPP